MTRLDKLKEELASDWQNSGCIKGLPAFENARTRWANKDFQAGFESAQAEYQKIIDPLVDALEFYANPNSWYLHKDKETGAEVRRSIVYDDTESFGFQSSPESKNILQVFAGKTAKEAIENYKKSVE